MRPLHASLISIDVFAAAAAQAATTDVGSQHDGVYVGHASPNTGVSTGLSCAPFMIGKVTISQGNLRSEAATGAATLTGIITEDGYVKASLARPGGDRAVLDGRLKGNTISAGFLETSSGCAWLIELKRESSPSGN